MSESDESISPLERLGKEKKKEMQRQMQNRKKGTPWSIPAEEIYEITSDLEDGDGVFVSSSSTEFSHIFEVKDVECIEWEGPVENWYTTYLQLYYRQNNTSYTIRSASIDVRTGAYRDLSVRKVESIFYRGSMFLKTLREVIDSGNEYSSVRRLIKAPEGFIIDDPA